MKDNLTTQPATLVVVCYSCCGDPQPTCRRVRELALTEPWRWWAMSAATDQATGAREMLSELRLLAIKGHLSNGRELVERWESALSHGEPGLGRLAAIRALLEALDVDLGELVLCSLSFSKCLDEGSDAQPTHAESA